MTHGYVIQIGPPENPNYFTGISYAVELNDAKVFRTARGAKVASHIWQYADYGRPIPGTWFKHRRAVAVSLVLTQGELL